MFSVPRLALIITVAFFAGYELGDRVGNCGPFVHHLMSSRQLPGHTRCARVENASAHYMRIYRNIWKRDETATARAGISFGLDSSDPPPCYETHPTVSANLAAATKYTHIVPEVALYALRHSYRNGYFIEAGSLYGGSAMRWIELALTLFPRDSFVLHCIDPGTGDVNMWNNLFGMLNAYQGRPHIMDQFIANMAAKGYLDLVVPQQTTALVGMRSLARQLWQKQPLALRPDLIYLDSAHEKDESYLELVEAYNLIPDGGFLVGDDYAEFWPGLVSDILRFVATLPCVQNASVDPRCTRWPDGLELLPRIQTTPTPLPPHPLPSSNDTRVLFCQLHVHVDDTEDRSGIILEIHVLPFFSSLYSFSCRCCCYSFPSVHPLSTPNPSSLSFVARCYLNPLVI